MSNEEDSEDNVMAAVKQLRRDYESHMVEHRIRDRAYDEKHERAMTAIADLAEATKPMVEAYKVVNGVQRFFKWLSGFAIVGGAIAYLSKHFHI